MCFSFKYKVEVCSKSRDFAPFFVIGHSLGQTIWQVKHLIDGFQTAACILLPFFGTALGAAAVFFLGRWMPEEPEKIVIDPNYVYGIAGGVIAYLLGRSRRGAFVCGVLGVLLADIAVAVMNRMNGVHQMLYLGSAGAMDVVVLSGFLAVLLAELVGEVTERISRHGSEEKTPAVYSSVKGEKQK